MKNYIIIIFLIDFNWINYLHTQQAGLTEILNKSSTVKMVKNIWFNM